MKCDCCGSLAGFHFEGCPRKAGKIIVFELNGEYALGTIERVLPYDWMARYVRLEGGHWNSCCGYDLIDFFDKFSIIEQTKMFSDPKIDKKYLVNILRNIGMSINNAKVN